MLFDKSIPACFKPVQCSAEKGKKTRFFGFNNNDMATSMLNVIKSSWICRRVCLIVRCARGIVCSRFFLRSNSFSTANFAALCFSHLKYFAMKSLPMHTIVETFQFLWNTSAHHRHASLNISKIVVILAFSEWVWTLRRTHTHTHHLMFREGALPFVQVV